MSAKEDVCEVGSGSPEPVLNMSDEIEIYNKINGISRRDAETSLREYSPKFKWPKNKARVLDIGSGDGSVTSILSKYLPRDYEVLVGADINPKSLKFASDMYKNDRIKYVLFNVEGELPDDMKESFDHVFSFYTFHWVDNHQKAFTNIYNILQKNGEFFTIFLMNSDFYLVYKSLAKSKKWSPWMSNYDKFPSPYYEFQDPDVYVTKMLKNIGFKVHDVRCKQKFYCFESTDFIKDLLTAITPFDVPKDMWPEFLEEFIEMDEKMQLIDDTKRVKHHYNLMLIHCSK